LSIKGILRAKKAELTLARFSNFDPIFMNSK
jgi:hypothetical protein